MKQKGFTLVEVLVVTAIGGVLMMGLMLSIHNVVFGTGRTNSQVVALTDVNNAALRLRKDIQMAQNTDLTDGVPQQDSISLGWIDYTSFESENESTSHSSSYTLSSTELQRNYDGTVSIVGRNITSIVFTQNGREVTVVITATGSGFWQLSETLEFSVYRRSEEIE